MDTVSSSTSEEEAIDIYKTTTDEDGIKWFMDLYAFDNNDKLRVFRCGYKPGKFYSEAGLVYKANGNRGKLTSNQVNVKANHRSKTKRDAAREYAKQTWEEKQRVHRYKARPQIPKTKELKKWRENDTRRWPAVCKDWKNCKEEHRVCTEDYPWYGQGKVNGDRCTAWLECDNDAEVTYRKIKLYARSCAELEFKKAIRRDCLKILLYIKETYPKIWPCGLDGELHAPSMKYHQKSRSIISRTVNEHVDEGELKYVLFDLMQYKLKFYKRCSILDAVGKYFSGDNSLEKIVFLETKELTSGSDVIEYFNHCAKIGYDEGIVLRRFDLLYTKKMEYKHNDMLKLKAVYDGEYEVVGYKEGNGTRKGCVVWEVRDPVKKKVKFWCDQVGTIEHQKCIYKTADNYIGKLLTVQYMSVSEDGVPLFPHGIRFRSAEDLADTNIGNSTVSESDD